MKNKAKSRKNKTKPWYKFIAAVKADEPSQLLIYGDIGENFWGDESVTAKSLVKDLAAVEGGDVIVRINSVGGSVSDGVAIFNALKRHSGSVSVIIDSAAYSAASLIAMAGDTIEMPDNSMMMIHAPKANVGGNAEELRNYAEILDKHSDAMGNAYVRSNGPDKKTIDGWLKDGDDHYFTADEAFELGLIDVVGKSLDAVAIADQINFGSYVVPKAIEVLSLVDTHTKKGKIMKKTKTDTGNAPADLVVEGGSNGNVDSEAIITARNAEMKIRNEAIIAVLNPHMHIAGIRALKDTSLIDVTMSVDAVRNQALDIIGKDYTPAAPSTPDRVYCVEDAQDKRIDGVTTMIMARANIKQDDGKRIVMAGNPWRGMSLMDVARDSLSRTGFDTRGMSKMEVVAAAFSQSESDFPILLENAMHKALLAGYNTAPFTWNRFCAVGTVSDFRAHNRYTLGSLGNLDSLNELGEFENKTIPDGRKESVSIDTKGNIINISRKAIIDDDLGAFVGLASSLGRAGRRTIESAVFTTLALNSGLGPVLADSKTLFHADHGNIGTGAAISIASIDADRVLMASQTDVSGNDYLDLRPSVLLLAIGLGGTARELNAQEYNDEATKNQRRPNTVRGLYNDIVDTPRLTGTARYSFADPSDAPVLEVSFLDGEQEPFLDVQEGFSVDGARYKARLDFGVSGVGYEGAVYNAGA
jgi:ATP-dependent protease ClpP protease subunit